MNSFTHTFVKGDDQNDKCKNMFIHEKKDGGYETTEEPFQHDLGPGASKCIVIKSKNIVEHK